MALKNSLPPIVFPDSTILILGTMPGEKSIQLQEYYAHPGNQFRRLLTETFSQPNSKTYQDFLNFLEDKKIALWNVIQSCERSGSSDSAIRNATPNLISEFLESNRSILKICFESKKAEQFYDAYFDRKDNIEYCSLPSGSGLFSRIKFEEKLQIYKRCLK